MTSVYLTVPNRSGWMHKQVHYAVCLMLSDPRYVVRHQAPTHSPYVANLHRCMWDFLAGGDDYWLSMDDDNPPTGNPLDHIESDLDLVGCPTPVWYSSVQGDRPYYYNAVDKFKDGYVPHDPAEGLQAVDAISTGCFLVSRRVIEAVKDKQPFMRHWGEDGLVTKGCDFAFCDKVKAAGFDIWADYDKSCRHFKQVDLADVIQSFGQMKVEA